MKKSPLTILKATVFSTALTGVMLLSIGCESDAQTNALIGAGLGAALGQAIGGDTKGTLIGAGIGAGAGYAIGNEADKKKQGQGGNYDY